MAGRDHVESIDALPLEYRLDEPYGSARGLVASRSLTLVRLRTRDGVTGWGECFGPPRAVVPLVEELGAQLSGAPLERWRPLLARELQQGYHRGGAGLHVSALSGVDIAGWDAWGRALGVSVGSLLGGRARDHVPAYASTGYATADLDPAAFRRAIESAVHEGFGGAKIKIGFGLPVDRQRAGIAREVLGPHRALMVDFNGNCTAAAVVDIVEALRELGLYWLEEPVPPEDLAGYERLRVLSVRLAGGEALFTRHGFRPFIAGGLIDIAQPDVAKCGGLSEARVIGELARTWNVRVSPHCWGGAVSLAATLQLLGSLPDYPHAHNAADELWLEYDRAPNGLRDELLSEPLKVVEGNVAIPNGPGLGIEVDEDALRRFHPARGDGG